MESRIILIKFPNNNFHTASVNRFVTLTINGKDIDTIWYVDLTEANNTSEKKVGSFSIIRDNKDGTYTNMNCGTPDVYEKIFDVIKSEISKKNYKYKDINILPYAIDTIENFDFFKEIVPEKKPQKVNISKNVREIKREISTRIGAFVDPYYKTAYSIMEEDLCSRLTYIDGKMTPKEWEEVENDILSYITLKKLDMKQGYILISDVSNAIKEIEQIALEVFKDSEFANQPIVVQDEEEAPNPELPVEEPVSESPVEEVVVAEEKKEEEYIPYVKTIYTLWNELYSTLSNFIYFEYDSYTTTPNCNIMSYINITNDFKNVNKELSRIIGNNKLSIKNKNLISVNNQQTRYNFYIIPVEDYDVFIALKESKNPYIITKSFEDSFNALLDAINRNSIIVTETETIRIIK